MVDNLAESLQGAEILRLDRRGVGKLFLQCGENFHALDRIDAEVGIKGHLQLQHLFRVTGFFSDDREQRRCNSTAVCKDLCSRCGSDSYGGRCHTGAQMLDDLAESLQGAEILRLDRRGVGKLFLQCGENFHALDRIDAEVGIKGHLQLQHLFRVTGLFGDDREQGRRNLAAVNARACNLDWSCGKRSRDRLLCRRNPRSRRLSRCGG